MYSKIYGFCQFKQTDSFFSVSQIFSNTHVRSTMARTFFVRTNGNCFFWFGNFELPCDYIGICFFLNLDSLVSLWLASSVLMHIQYGRKSIINPKNSEFKIGQYFVFIQVFFLKTSDTRTEEKVVFWKKIIWRLFMMNFLLSA